MVKNAVCGVESAFHLAPSLGKKLSIRPFINVSIGMRGDPHIRKAILDAKKCSCCGTCIAVCLQKAISAEIKLNEKRCIGCGECAKVCPVNAISFFDKRHVLNQILPECLRQGVETFELHAIIPDDEAVMADWQLMNIILKNNYISMCLDRLQLSDDHLIRRIRAAYQLTGDRFIVQADGIPMSGGADDYNTTLQAVAISDVIRKSGIPVMILASGGTNSKTGELAKICGVKVNGVSIGTFARKIVSTYIEDKQFETNLALIRAAVDIAEALVNINLEQISG